MNNDRILKKIQEKYSLGEIWKDGIWLQNQVLSGRIHKNTLYYIEVQSRLMQEVYPNNWSFDLTVVIKSSVDMPYIHSRSTFPNMRVKRQTQFEFYFYPVIRFENLKIENTIGHSLLIKSIYVKLNTAINRNRNYRYYISNMYGTRDKITYNEYQNGYGHSHLTQFSYSSSTIKFQHGFCLGTGEINMMFTKLSQEFQEGFFKTLLFHLKGYLEWESLEGVPYRRIENLFLANKNEGLAYRNIVEVDNIGKLILQSRLNNKTLTKCNLKWKVENNKLVIVDNEELENYCLPFTSKSVYGDNSICYKDDKGNYYPINATVNSVTIPDNSYIIFKGEKRYLEVEGLLDTSNRKFYIHPQIKQYVKSKLEYEANRNYVRHSTIEELQSKSNNATAIHV